MSALPQSRRLTNTQASLLQLVDRDLPETDLLEMRRVLLRHFAGKAEQKGKRTLQAKARTNKDIEQAGRAINENRTEYLCQLRAKA